MKSNYMERPDALVKLTDGNWMFNWNITEVQMPSGVLTEGEEETTVTAYECDTVEIKGTPTVAKITRAIVRDTYTEEEEAVLNAVNTARMMGISDETDDGTFAEYMSLTLEARTLAQAAITEFENASE